MTVFIRMSIVALVGLLSLQLVGCAKKASCQSSSSACGTFQACCTSTDCYYTYNNKRYDCDGTDCTDAAKRLAADMCGTAKRLASEPLSPTEQEALNKTKMLLETNSPCMTCP